MTTPTLNSVYPPSVSDLLPRARTLAVDLGSVPSRNALMREFGIGAPKATAIRDALLAERTAEQRRAEVETYHLTRGGLATFADVIGDAAPDPAEPVDQDVPDPDPSPVPAVPAEPIAEPVEALPIPVGHPDTPTAATTPVRRRAPVRTWPLILLSLPAAVAVWSGWVGLGSLTGFGMVHPLPGIADGFAINSAITLPVGVETYAAFALRVWLSGAVPAIARKFARWSAIGSLALGSLGQVAYHVLAAAHVTAAPWWLTAAVATLPVAVLGMGAALAHLIRGDG